MLSDGGHDGKCDIVGILVFPGANYRPTGGRQAPVSIAVARDVAGDLRRPVVGVRPGLGPMLRAAVPVAAIDEDRDPRASEHEVRAPVQPRKGSRVDDVPQPT